MGKTVTVIGVGALGSNLLPLLRNLEVQLFAVDFDRVEQKNVTTQFYSKASVGKAKVVAVSQMMNFLWGTVVKVFPHKLTTDNAFQIMSQQDPDHLIVDCLDNAASRQVIQDHVRKYGLPCVHGGLSADGQFGRVIWDKDFVIDSEDVAGQATCEGGEHLPFISIVASFLAQAVKMWATGSKHVSFSITPGGVFTI